MVEDTLDTIEPTVDSVSTPELSTAMLNPVSNFQGLRNQDAQEELDTQNFRANESITMGDRFNAALRRENFVGSYLSSGDMRKELSLAHRNPQEGYNPFDGDIEGYEDHVEEFTKAYTPAATEAIKRQIDREIEDRRIMETGALGGVGYDLLATITDPTQWALAIATGGVGNFARGVSITRKAVQVGLIGGAETVVTEVGLQNTQTTRSYLESAFNISGATLLGGVAGAGLFKTIDMFQARDGLGHVGSDTVNATSRGTINTDTSHSSMEAGNISSATSELNIRASEELGANLGFGRSRPLGGRLVGDEATPVEARSASSASTNTFINISDEALEIAGNTRLQRAAKAGVNSKVSNALYKHSPILRTVTSENSNTKNVVTSFAENALIMQNNYTGDLMGSIDYAIKKSDLDNLRVTRSSSEVKAEQDILDANYKSNIIKAEEEATKDFDPSGEGSLKDAVRVAEFARKSVAYEVAPLQTEIKLGDLVKAEAKRLIDTNVSPRVAMNEAISNVMAKEGNVLGERVKPITDSFKLAFEGKYVGSQASNQAAETIASKEQAVYANKLERIESDYFAQWNKLRGNGLMSNKKVDFNTRAFYVYNLDESNTSRILDASDIVEGSPEFNLLVKYAKEVKREIMEPLQGDIEGYLPSLWSNITTGGVENADGVRVGGELKDANYLHRKYNTENITKNHEVFKNILIKHIKEGDSFSIKEAQQNASIYAEAFSKAKEEVSLKQSEVNKLEKELEELEELFEDSRNELSDSDLTAIHNSIGSKRETIERANSKLDTLYVTLNKAEEGLDSNLLKSKPMNDAQLSEAAEATIQTIKIHGGVLNPSDMVKGNTVSDVFKARTIKLPNEAFLASNPDAMGVDFINTNLNYSITRAIEGVTTETSIAKAFEKKGSFKFWREVTSAEKKAGVKSQFIRDPKERNIENIDDIKDYIHSGYIEKIAKGDDLGTIGKQTKSDLEDIDVMYERMRGNRGGYSNPSTWVAKASKTALASTSVAYLGKVTLSSAPDVGRSVIRNGFQESFDSFTLVMGKKFRGEMKAMKRDELEAMGIGANAAMNKRAQMFSDTKGMYDETQAWDRGLETLTSKFFQFTGINHWNDMLQTVNAVSSISNAIKLGENLAKGIKPKEVHLAQARALGLSDEDMKGIYKQWVDAGSKVEGRDVRLANIEQWSDPELSNKFTNAVHADVRQTVIEAGIGDKPSWYDMNPFTRHITQFQTFISASVTRSMLSGMQTDGIRAMQGVTIMLGLAHAVRYAKAYIDDPSGEKADKITEESTKTKILEAIDRTGMVPLLSYLNRYGTPLTGINFTGGSTGRYTQMSQTRSAVAGPTLGLLEKGADIGANLYQGLTGGSDNKSATEHLNSAGDAASRIMPFANFYGISYLTNMYRESH